MRKVASKFFVRRDSDASEAPVGTPAIASRGLIAKVLNSRQGKDAKRQRLDTLTNEDVCADESEEESSVSHSRLFERPGSVHLRRDEGVDLRALASSTTTADETLNEDHDLSLALRAVQAAFERQRTPGESHSSISSSISSSPSQLDRSNAAIQTSEWTCLSCPSPTPAPRAKKGSLVSLQSLRPLSRRRVPASPSTSFTTLRTLVLQEIAESRLRFPDTPSSRLIYSQLEEVLLHDALWVITESQRLFYSRHIGIRSIMQTEGQNTHAMRHGEENSLVSTGINSPGPQTSLLSRPRPPARTLVSVMR